MGGKIIPRIRLTLAKDLVEVEAELGKNFFAHFRWQSAREGSENFILSSVVTILSVILFSQREKLYTSEAIKLPPRGYNFWTPEILV